MNPMNNRVIRYVGVLTLGYSCALGAQTVTPPTPLATVIAQNQRDTDRARDALTEGAQRFIFAAWNEVPTANQTASDMPLYPTISQNEREIDRVYSAQGLKIADPWLTYIKCFYFYFEYCVRRERAAQIFMTLGTDDASKQEWMPLLSKPNAWRQLTALASAKNSSYKTLKPIDDLTNNKEGTIAWRSAWGLVTPAIMATPTAEDKSPDNFWTSLTSTSFWQEIPLTNTDLINSFFWQTWIKMLILKTFDVDRHSTFFKAMNAEQMFTFLPHIEIAYYSDEFAARRYQTELLELNLMLSNNTRNRLLTECPEWNIKKDDVLDFAAITKLANSFKNSDFHTVFITITNPTCWVKNRDTLIDAEKAVCPVDAPFMVAGDSITLNPMQGEEPHRHLLLFAGMAMAIQTHLQNALYTDATLPATASELAKLKTTMPLLLPYKLEDTPYLDDYNALKDLISEMATRTASADTTSVGTALSGAVPAGTAASGSTAHATSINLGTLKAHEDNEEVRPQGFGGFGNFITAYGHKLERDLKGIAFKGVFAGIKDLGTIYRDEARVVYYQSGLATVIQHVPPHKAAQLAMAYKDATDQDITNFSNDVQHLVYSSVNLVLETGSAGEFGLVVAGLADILHDPTLSKDYQGILDSISDAIATYAAASVHNVGEWVTRLSPDGLALIAGTIVELSTGNFAGYGDQWKMLAYDIVTATLESVTIGLGALKHIISELISSVGYLLKSITDTIVDVGAVVATVMTPRVWENPSSFTQYYDHYQNFLEAHQILIATSVAVGLLAGIFVLTTPITVTSGVGVALFLAGAGLTVAMGGVMIASAVQEDTQVAELKKEFEDYVQQFSAWTKNQEVIVQTAQENMVSNVSAQLNSALTTSKLGLGFHKNYLRDLATRIECQVAQSLGSYLAEVLSTDEMDVAAGDVGNLYGFQTSWVTTNPSQGLVLYEPGRGTDQKGAFTQEVAQMPTTFASSSGGVTTMVPRYWFLQSLTKDLAWDAGSPFTFEVRIKPVYLLDTYCVGIGLGGAPLAAGAAEKNQYGNIDRYAGAKMLVFTNAGKKPSIGLFEHATPQKGDQWIADTISGPAALVPGVWYRLRATLSGGSMVVTVWREDSEPEASMQFTVTPQPSRQTQSWDVCPPTVLTDGPALTTIPCSIIYSGASIEFEIVTPGQHNEIKATQTFTNVQGPFESEAQREATSQNAYAAAMAPRIGALKLTARSPFEIMKGNYLYNLNNSDDVVLLATVAAGDVTTTSLGIPPTNAANATISVVSGKTLNQRGELMGYQSNVWQTYTKSLSSVGAYIASDIITGVDKLRETFVVAQTGPFALGSYTFTLPQVTANGKTGYLTDLARNGQYVYQTTIDGLTHYVLLGTVNQNNLMLYGLAYEPNSTTINGFVSLINFMVYRIDSKTPVSTLSSGLLDAYVSTHGSLPTTLMSAIAAATKAYTAQHTTVTSPQQSTPAPSLPSIQSNSVSTTPRDPPPAGPPAPLNQSAASLNDQQNDASVPPSWG